MGKLARAAGTRSPSRPELRYINTQSQILKILKLNSIIWNNLKCKLKRVTEKNAFNGALDLLVYYYIQSAHTVTIQH